MGSLLKRIVDEPLKAIDQLRRRSRFLPLLAVPLALLALASLARGVQNGLGLSGTSRSLDLAPYWLGGRLLLSGVNPYRAAVDGTLWRQLPADIAAIRPGFGAIPANAPLQMLLMAPLAQMDWSATRAVVVAFNLAAAIAVPLLAIDLMANRPGRDRILLLALLFWAQLPTRNVIANGQTSLIVLAGSLLAVRWSAARPYLAGAALAVGLLKYSLTLPLILWFLALGLWIPVLIAGGLHLAAALVMSWLLAETMPALLGSFAGMLLEYGGLKAGFDLVGLIRRVGAPPAVGWILSAGVGLATMALLLRMSRLRRDPPESPDWRRASGALLALAMSFSSALLLVYHRAYDGLVLIVFLIAIWDLRSRSIAAAGSRTSERLMSLATVTVVVIFLLPRSSLEALLPGWERSLLIASSLAVLLAWVVSAWGFLLASRRPVCGSPGQADAVPSAPRSTASDL